jgi:hypothetical protein
VSSPGKLLYEAVNARLSAQKDDVAALGNRAKDLLGLTSLAGTATSLVANDKLFNVVKANPPAWWKWAAGITVAVAITTGLLAMLPRTWTFSTEPETLAKRMASNDYADAADDDWYWSIASGFLEERPQRIGLRMKSLPMSRLEHQSLKIGRVAAVVTIQSFALASLLALAFLLLLIL